MNQPPIQVILNPYARRWYAQTQIEPLKQALRRAGLDFGFTVTQSPGEGVALARQAALNGASTVVAAGGDSTIGEVMNGLVQAAGDGTAGTLGIVPLGTANDLADILQIPRNLDDACRRIAAGQTRVIDICQVNDRYFDNNSAVGLEPVVTLEAESIRRIQGSLRYIVAALRAIWKHPQWHARLEWDGGSYDGPITLISVGNSPRTGGAFFMTPKAQLDDGLLDFVVAPALSRLSMLKLMPQTFSGKHIHAPRMIYAQTTRLRISISPSPLQADGEIIDRQATSLEYRILPQKLRVIV